MAERPDPPTLEHMRDYEARAETAYGAMYDAPSYDQKDLKDDALFFLARAEEIARALGLVDEAERLKQRADGIVGVYNAQFRYIGR